MQEPILTVTNLSAGYGGKVALSNVSLEVNRSDFIGIIGPNGGGKTTLLKAIVGTIKPLQGSLKIHTSQPIGYLPQLSNHDEHFPILVNEVILSGLFAHKGIWGIYTKDDNKKVDYWIKFAGIEKLKNKRFGSLSGGQRQRVLLCRALVGDPELLILDEPDTFVDNKFEGELYELLKKLNDTKAIMLVSHDLGTIAGYVKSIACVNRTLYHHKSNIISEQQLQSYNCPIQLLVHSTIPHNTIIPPTND